jgi:phage tail-like protein
MTQSPTDQKTSYPLPAYNFKATIEGQSISFTEVSGISIEYETLTYRHGFSAWEGETVVRWLDPKYIPISLKKGMVAGNRFLYQWLTGSSSSSRPMDISLCDETGAPVVTWRIARAVPVKLEAPAFDAAATQLAIEKLDLMVSGISIEHH